ncbi:MAG: hypothetical protein ACT4OY_08670 [Alphaproteobacteria bacterium]
MNMKPIYKIYKIFLSTVAVLALGVALPATAETVTQKTVVKQMDMANVQKTNFSAFDMNHDGVLSMAEVGEKLFYLFDADGNEIIDNIEFGQNRVMTIIPMEKESFTYVDLNHDGAAESITYDRDTFIQQSRLARFDNDHDGLSAKEFIGESFLRLDDDKSKAIELEEWKEEYVASVRPKAAEQERYQD